MEYKHFFKYISKFPFHYKYSNSELINMPLFKTLAETDPSEYSPYIIMNLDNRLDIYL